MNLSEYKRNWYLKNRDRILEKNRIKSEKKNQHLLVEYDRLAWYDYLIPKTIR